MPKANEGRVSMQVIVQKLDAALEIGQSTQNTVNEMREHLAKHQVHIDQWIGPPSIEDKLRSYVDERNQHKENNFTQALMNLQKVVSLETENAQLKTQAEIRETNKTIEATDATRKIQHTENSKRYEDHEKRMRWLEYRVYGVAGAVIALQIYKDFFAK